MNFKNPLVLLAATLVLLFIFWRVFKNPDMSSDLSQEPEIQTPLLPETNTIDPDAPAPSASPLETKGKASPQPPPTNSAEAPGQTRQIRRMIPSLSEIRKQVRQNPHITPEAQVRFSLEIGARLDQVRNETEASQFLDELRDCTEAPAGEVAISIQALCLSTAKDALRKYPSLRSQYERLAEKAHPEARKLSNMTP